MSPSRDGDNSVVSLFKALEDLISEVSLTQELQLNFKISIL
jgi:hypothetical protein